MEFGMHRAKRLFLWAGCLLAIGCLWILCSLEIRQDRKQARIAAETTASNFAKAFEEHIRSTVIQIDSTLLTMRDDYVQHPEYFADQLAIYKKNLYHKLIIQVSVIDAKGIMVFNEQSMPKVPLNLSDREHFRVHRNSANDLLFISKPVFGRVSKRWSIQFTRKILRRDGTFAGVMVISVDPDFFTSFFRSFDLGKNGVVSLVGMDRVIRARSVSANDFDILPADRPFFDATKPEAGIYHASSAIDGVARIYAYRRFSNYPLAVTVGLADEGVYRSVDPHRDLLILFSAILSALLLAGTKIVFFFDKEQSRTERSLREAKQRLELATASGHLGVWQWDIRTGELSWDHRMEELYGIEPGSFSGRFADFEAAVHPDDLPSLRNAFAAAVKGEGELSAEFRTVRPDGSVRIIKADGLAIPDAAGGAVRMIGLNCDITERMAAVNALRESEKRFRTLAEASFEGIAIADRERFVDVNNQLARMLGFEREELIGLEVAATLPPESARAMGVIATGCDDQSEHEMVCKDGSRRFVEVHGRSFVQNGRELRIVAIRDVTDRKRMEKALQDREEQARQDMVKTQKLQSLGVLAGGIAHDFNNILTSVFTNVSLARFQLKDSEKTLQRLTDAEKAITRATDLTRQLLTFARGGTPIKKIVSVNPLLREAAGFALHGSNANCEFDLADDLWPVEADEGQISQVIHNLILNAIQAMPSGGTAVIRSENAGSTDGDGREVRISVVDTGVGIPGKILQEIFDPYFTTKPHGNGLGLATCYSIVKKHGGRITVSSAEGKGSTFTVSLPAAERGIVPEGSAREELIHGSGRILVMDDDASIRGVAQAILEELGYDVEVAENGARAVELYRTRKVEGTPFSVVILDMTVQGGMGGKEAMEKLLEIDPGVRAIVSSGYSDDTVMANYRHHGFQAVLSKPYLPHQMSEILKKVIGAGIYPHPHPGPPLEGEGEFLVAEDWR